MFFKKLFFILASLLFLPHCGLEVGEETANPFIYKIEGSDSFCDILNYKSELKSYVNDTDYTESNRRVKHILSCFVFKINQYVKSVVGDNQDYFTDEEIFKLLNEPFIKTESTAPIIEAITSHNYYHQIRSSKDSLIDAMKKYQSKESIEFEDYCPKIKKGAVSREEVDTFTVFLEDFSDFLISINTSAEKLFNLFHDLQGTSPILLKKDHLLPSFERVIKNKLWNASSNFQSLDEDQLDAVISSLTVMLFDYDKLHGEGILTRSHIKYMLLNLYLVEMFFNLYDKNHNLILESDELRPIFCLFKPIIALFTMISLEDRFFSFVLKPFFTERVVFNYILKNKEIPKKINLKLIQTVFPSINIYDTITVYHESILKQTERNVSVNYIGVTEIFGNLFKGFMKVLLDEPKAEEQQIELKKIIQK